MNASITQTEKGFTLWNDDTGKRIVTIYKTLPVYIKRRIPKNVLRNTCSYQLEGYISPINRLLLYYELKQNSDGIVLTNKQIEQYSQYIEREGKDGI